MTAELIRLDKSGRASSFLAPPGGNPPLDGGGGGGDDRGVSERVAALEAIIPTLATKTDLADTRIAIEGVRSDLRGWMLATVLTIIGTMLAAIFGVSQVMKPTPPPTAQPTVIVVPAAAAAPAPPASR